MAIKTKQNEELIQVSLEEIKEVVKHLTSVQDNINNKDFDIIEFSDEEFLILIEPFRKFLIDLIINSRAKTKTLNITKSFLVLDFAKEKESNVFIDILKIPLFFKLDSFTDTLNSLVNLLKNINNLKFEINLLLYQNKLFSELETTDKVIHNKIIESSTLQEFRLQKINFNSINVDRVLEYFKDHTLFTNIIFNNLNISRVHNTYANLNLDTISFYFAENEMPSKIKDIIFISILIDSLGEKYLHKLDKVTQGNIKLFKIMVENYFKNPFYFDSGTNTKHYIDKQMHTNIIKIAQSTITKFNTNYKYGFSSSKKKIVD